MATDKRLVKSKSGLRIVTMKEADLTSPFHIPEPDWVPDNEYIHCMQCQVKFALMNRRHHCRRCGRLFCGRCCDNKVSLPRMCFIDPVRVCGGCSRTTKLENEFFDRHLKVLLNGCEFYVFEDLTSEPSDNSPIFFCKLSSDHRFVICESDSQSREPLLLCKVERAQVITEPNSPVKGGTVRGLLLTYEGERGEVCCLKMLLPPSTHRQGLNWINAMQRAFRLLYETRNQDQ
ncbi:zinc finger FYVE domain-containing protein 21 [Argonauta hians]